MSEETKEEVVLEGKMAEFVDWVETIFEFIFGHDRGVAVNDGSMEFEGVSDALTFFVLPGSNPSVQSGSLIVFEQYGFLGIHAQNGSHRLFVN